MGSEFPDKPLHSFRNLLKIIWLFRGNIDSKTKVFFLNICPLCVWRAIKELSNYQGLGNCETGNQCLLTLSREHTDLTGKEINPAIPAIPAIPSNKMAFKSKERDICDIFVREFGDV